MHTILVERSRCILGEMKEEYLPAHTGYLNDPEVNRFIFSRPPFTIEQQRKWLLERRRAGDQILAVLVHQPTETAEESIFVGVVQLRDIDLGKRIAHSGIVIGNKHYWGKGIARMARLIQLKLAFDELCLDWVYSETVRPNIRSQRFLENTGYELYNVSRKARIVEGVWCDEFHYRISRLRWLLYWRRMVEKTADPRS